MLTRHAERRLVAHAPQQLFDLVADVRRYPEFLPWCHAARVRSRDGDVEIAELAIGFGPFHEKFTSRVTLAPQDAQGPRIDTVGIEGPFRRLVSRWIFHPHSPLGKSMPELSSLSSQVLPPSVVCMMTGFNCG